MMQDTFLHVQNLPRRSIKVRECGSTGLKNGKGKPGRIGPPEKQWRERKKKERKRQPTNIPVDKPTDVGTGWVRVEKKTKNKS